jgi:hypothetical protein
MDRNSLLECKIENGVLTMQIGVDVIAHAVKLNPDLQHYDEKSGEFREPTITDPDKFAAEILKELKAESEDGTTLIHVALDKAAENAIECGAEGIELPGDR